MEADLVEIRAGSVTLKGNLKIPEGAKGVVVFAHGSGSGRHSPRNQFVAKELQKGNLATLLIDLLTEEEEVVDAQTAHLRFDIELLAGRLQAVAQWLQPKGYNIGYFGASTGAAAALVAAARHPQGIAAIVSRGGRPDLAGSALPQVKAPVLLLVGGEDYPVIEMNEEALQQLTCKKKLMIVPHATHLFEEPGTLEEVARHARDWFQRYLA